jgi:hypothetical protein
MSQLDYSKGDPSWKSVTDLQFLCFLYIELCRCPIAYNIATSLSLLRYRDCIRFCSLLYL